MLISRQEVHSRQFRAGGTLTMSHHRTAIFQRSFTYNAVKLYNSLPNQLLNLNVSKFKVNYKKLLSSVEGH